MLDTQAFLQPQLLYQAERHFLDHNKPFIRHNRFSSQRNSLSRSYKHQSWSETIHVCRSFCKM